MRQAAGDLALDQFRVHGFADVVSHDVALDRHAAGFGVDADGCDVNAVRVDHVRRLEGVLGGQALRQCAGDFAKRHRRAAADADHFAVDDVELVGAGLHQLRGVVQRLVAQFGRGKPRGLAAHDGDARRESAHAFVDAVGLAVDDIDGGVVDAERVGADLGDHGFHTLTDRRDAGNHFDAA